MTNRIDTAENLTAAEADGYAAYGEDRMNVPSWSPVIQAVIGDIPVGYGAAELYAAFSVGYNRATDEAAAAILGG